MKRDCHRNKSVNFNSTITEITEEKNIRQGLMAISRGGLMKATATLEKRDLEVSFDTGAEISIISYKTAVQHQLKIRQSEIKIKVADNSVVTPMGETEPLDLKLGESACELIFIVMNHDDHQVLLGLDWFLKTGAVLSPRENTITFPKRIIQVNNADMVTTVEELTQGSDGRPVGMMLMKRLTR